MRVSSLHPEAVAGTLVGLSPRRASKTIQGMPQRVPALVVTGFLGSGKTTLLRRLIEGQPGVRFAVVVNEFGETGFDGALIASQCADVIELVNGCVCCRVGEDFVPTLEKIIERDMPPEVILIETSGLALPQPVIEAFEFPTLKARTRLAGVVTLADAGQILSGTFDAALSRARGDLGFLFRAECDSRFGWNALS